MNRIRLAAACAVALVSAGMALAATTYYVATNGNDNANCGSSASPCRHIQYAIDKSIDGDTVRVKNGTYNECFIVPTYLSGVLRVTVEADTFATAGTVGGAILDGTGACDAGSATPAPVAVVMYDSVLRGFKIQHGGNSGVLGLGAVAITNNTITGNASTYGGDPSFSYAGGGIFAYTGIYVTSDDTKLQIKSNTISSNTSSQSGGGIYVAANGDGFPSVVEIQNNTLTGNVAGPDPVPGSLGTFGGAIAVFTDAYTPADSSSVVITNNTIDGNTAHKTADGYPAYGGGIFVATGAYTGYGTETVQIGDVGASNAVRNNRAEGYGGGISADLQPGIATPGHTMKVVGNSVTANSGERGAGGIHGFFLTADPTGGLGTLEITDNTITGNHAEAPAGSGALGGGGLFGEIYSKKTPAQYIAFKIEGNRIQNNDSNSIGGGASLFAYADDNPPLNQGGNGIKLPAGAQIDFKNNLVAQNTAVNNAPDPGPVRIPSVGGGVWAAGRAFGDQAFAGIDLEFLTVAGNHVDAGAAGGIELDARSEFDEPQHTLGAVAIELTNSIIANNESFGAGGPITPGGTISLDVRYNDAFQNGTDWEANLGVDTDPNADPPNGNISVDPGLDANFQPQLCSATVDAGDPATAVNLEPQPNGGRVNMGHLGGTVNATRTLPDSNGDGIVDGLDILRLAVAFGSNNTDNTARYNPAVDFDADGHNDGLDLSYLASLYARSCP